MSVLSMVVRVSLEQSKTKMYTLQSSILLLFRVILYSSDLSLELTEKLRLRSISTGTVSDGLLGQSEMTALEQSIRILQSN